MRTEARPLGQTIRYAYDANGNLTERIDPLNQRQVHTYDDANRRIRTEAFAAGAGSPSRTITYTYDPRGLLTGYADGITSATYAYDANGQKLSETVDYGRFSLTQGYSYHPNGQKASWTAPDGTVIGFAYTGHGELREVTVPGQGAITMSDFRWTRPETVTYPGGAVRTERYDALQRTRQITVRAGCQRNSIRPHSAGLPAIQRLASRLRADLLFESRDG
jgi:YD repeat-containing protein